MYSPKGKPFVLHILANRTYRKLFSAQLLSLFGTGLATVALGLLAFELAGDEAGAVLGTALAIKMIAYVGLSPMASVLVEYVPRKTLLVSLDMVRAGVALLLPFVSEVWHVYVLIFLLQAASAGFTPTFQATIPDILTEEEDYTRALSLSRLAYDLENLLSPAFAAALLLVMDFHNLFVGTAVGFAGSALLVASTRIPEPAIKARRKFIEQMLRGSRLYLATPRLRGLLAINAVVAAAGAMVIVNTVVFVQGVFGLEATSLAIALACYGAGSMSAALLLPQLLDRVAERPVMLTGAALLIFGCGLSSGLGSLPNGFLALLPVWFVTGVGQSLAMTPSGRLLARSAHPEDRPAIFAAQFALSHACWLVTYPLAGWLGASAGLPAAGLVLAAFGTLGALTALKVWPAKDIEQLEHSHPELPPDHPHLKSGERVATHRHVHRYVIDDLHYMWPHAH
jgi:MFS family permease